VNHKPEQVRLTLSLATTIYASIDKVFGVEFVDIKFAERIYIALIAFRHFY